MPKLVKVTPGVCPMGHALPYRSIYGYCSERACIEQLGAALAEEAAARAEDGPEAKEPAQVALESIAGLNPMMVARDEALGYASGLGGLNPTAFTAKRIEELAPRALAELEHQLLTGTESVRRDIAKDVLDRAGHSKKTDAAGFGGPVIVINHSGPLPWTQTPKPEVVEGEVVEDKK